MDCWLVAEGARGVEAARSVEAARGVEAAAGEGSAGGEGAGESFGEPVGESFGESFGVAPASEVVRGGGGDGSGDVFYLQKSQTQRNDLRMLPTTINYNLGFSDALGLVELAAP